MTLFGLLFGVALASPLAQTEGEAVPTLITNVAVLDLEGRVGPRRDVVFADGRIVAIEPVGSSWSLPDLVVIDGSGRTLLPGLIDLHVHLASTFAVPGHLRVPRPKRTLQSLLYAGVTTALDLSMERDAIDRLSERIEAGRISGPHLYRSGKPFTAPDGHPISSVRAVFPGPLVRFTTRKIAWTVQTSDDVDRAIARQGQTGFKKIIFDDIPHDGPVLSDVAAARLRLAATALDDRLVAHVGTPADVDRAIALEVDALMHAPSHGSLSEVQAHQLAVHGINVVATLAVWRATAQVGTGQLGPIPLEDELLTRSQRRDLERSRAGRTPLREPMATWAREVAASDTERDAAVRRLRDASVTVLVGSDSPGLGLPAGGGLHLELAALIDAGMDRSSVLRAVTYDNSRFLDPDANFGVVRVGYQADLVLVQGNPQADLSALEDIVEVWTDGRRVQRTARTSKRPMPITPPPPVR